MTAQLNSRDYEQLSAYLDGQLSGTDKARLEERMRVYQELRVALDEMRRTRMLLRQAPRRRAPRNFTLTPAMVQQRGPRKSSFFDLFPVLSFASAIATLALVFTFVFQLLPVGGQPMMTAAMPAAGELPAAEGVRNSATQQDNAAGAAEQAQPREAPQAMQPAPTQPAAGAADSSAVRAAPEAPIIMWNSGAFGKGGGGGGGDGYNLVIPKEAVSPLPSVSSGGEEMSQQSSQLYADVPPVQGTGPILGLPKSEDAGQYLEPLPTALPPLPTSTPAPTLDAAQVAAQETQESAPPALEYSSEPEAEEPAAPVESPTAALPLVWLQALLGGLALITGLAAYLIWRRSR